MGFDWQSFATGFLERTAENIKEAKGEARDYEERQRNLAERNAQTISRRRAAATQVASLASMLRSQGASEKVIQAAVSAGPKAIADLASKVESARSTYGRDLSSSDIETLVNIPEGFNSVDPDTESFIKRTYGLGYKGAGATDAKVEQTFMDRLTGRKQMDMARARLDSEVMQDGLTAYDINQMAAQQDYESLVPGTFISFVVAKVFNPADDMLDFTRTFSNILGDVQETSVYKALTQEIEQTRMNNNLSDDEKAKQIGSLLEQRDELILRSAGPTIESYVSTYGESFTDAATGFLRGYLSDSYVDSLTMDFEEEQDTEVEPLSAGSVDEQTSEAFVEPPVATGITTPEVTVSELPDAEEKPTPVTQEEEPPTELEADDMSIALLNKSGTDMLDYLKGKGVSSTEEMAIALNEWGQENGMIMPLDKGALIFALKPYVLED
jgi:hypothetical protein